MGSIHHSPQSSEGTACFWLTRSYPDEQCRALVMAQTGVDPPKPRAAGREVREASPPQACQPPQVTQ